MSSRSSAWAWATFWWGLVFGGLNLYWSAGGDFLLNRMGELIQREVAEGDTTLLVLNTAGGIGKILVGLLALGTIARWGRRIPRRLHLFLLYAGGILLVLYGGASWTQVVLAEIGVIDVPGSIGEHHLRWYLVLWEPLWIAGGVLTILSAESYRRSR